VTLQADVLLLSRTVITGSVLSAILMRAPLFPAELPTLIDEACAGRPPIAALTFDADRNLRRYVEALLPPPSFSQKRRVLRLQPLPAVTLEYRLPARFKTIPSRPSWQASANTSAPSATRASLNRMQWTPATSGDSAARRSSIER
jgi:hypothetical protein